jgi:hypothetical protein
MSETLTLCIKLKVVRVVVMSFRNLLAKGAFAAQMIDLGLPQIVQNLKAQAWTDEVRSFPNLLVFLIFHRKICIECWNLYI